MKRIIAIVAAAAAASVPALAASPQAQALAQRLAEAKAACPDCYRVIVTNGVCVGMTKPQYDAYKAAEKARAQAENARMKPYLEKRRKAKTAFHDMPAKPYVPRAPRRRRR